MTSSKEEETMVEDLRVSGIKPLIPPAILQEELPTSEEVKRFVVNGRRQANDIIHGHDDRLLVIVGPCSIHDSKAAIEYGMRKKKTIYLNAKLNHS